MPTVTKEVADRRLICVDSDDLERRDAIASTVLPGVNKFDLVTHVWECFSRVRHDSAQERIIQ